jgi:hypothetical protein
MDREPDGISEYLLRKALSSAHCENVVAEAQLLAGRRRR